MIIVFSVVVTHNRKHLLRKTLVAQTSQAIPPEKIIIVDNASTDGTHEMLKTEGWLDRPDVELLALPVNTGGAGGFYSGIKRAYELGADWIWVIDDDCIPAADALERLIASLKSTLAPNKENIGFLASRVLWKDGSPCLMNIPVPHHLWLEPHAISSNLTRISSSSFVSMLINRRAIKEVGLPVKEFFIWFDDAEYSRRISEKMPCYLVSDSIVFHETPENIAPLDLTQLTEKSAWKFHYGIRNQASYHFVRDGFAAGYLFCLKMLVRSFRHTNSWRMRWLVLNACWQGWRFDYEKLIEHVNQPIKSIDREARTSDHNQNI